MKYDLKKVIAGLVVTLICLVMLAGCGGGGGGGGAIPPGKAPSGEDNPVAEITSPSGDTEITEGDSLDFQGSATLGSGSYTYSWSFTGGSPASSTSQNPGEVTFSTEGEYIVHFTVTDSDSHSGSDTVTIKVVQANATVPDVVNIPQATAENEIIDANLIVGTVSNEYSATVLSGNVISQNPAAGSIVQAESAVNIVVSLGPPPSPATPDVVNMDLENAEAAIIAAGLTLGSVYIEYHSSVLKDLITRSIPASGTHVAPGSLVDLVISMGPVVAEMTMNHKGVNINYSNPKYPTDSIWDSVHQEPYSVSDTTWEATSEYLYSSNPDTPYKENITTWSGTFTDVPLKRFENTDTDIEKQETRGLTGTVSRDIGNDGDVENDELIGEITVSMISYAVQTGEFKHHWFANASWEILGVNDENLSGLMYMTCEDFNQSEVWGRVEGDIHGLYHADNVTNSVFSRVEIISIDGDESNMFPLYIQWDTVLSENMSWHAENVMYIQEGISWVGQGVGNYMNGDLSLTGDNIYLPFFNAGKYTGTWDLEDDYTGEMFSYLYLCPEGSVIVPFVEGLTDEGAESVLNDNDLNVTPTQEFSSTVPVGHVISQAPQAGQQAGINSSVNLTVSEPTSDWKCVSAGFNHTLAIDNDGHLWAWGDNTYGQLGTGDTLPRLGPVLIGFDTDWQQVSAGRRHSLAIKNGHLWAWGSNENYQLGRTDITGISTDPIPVDETRQWSIIAAGGMHSLAVDADSDLWAWGDNSSGQLGDGTYISRPTPIRIDNDKLWSAIEAGSAHSIGIDDREGIVYAWGSNEFVQLGIGEVDENYTAYTPTQVLGDINDHSVILITAGANHNIAIDDQGWLWSWGDNSSGQLGLNDTENMHTPTAIPTIHYWSDASAGWNHTLAKRNFQNIETFWAWGDNMFGQLGNGESETFLDVPTEISSMSGTEAFSAGGLHSVVIMDDVDDPFHHGDNAIWTWGGNSSGQLGNRTYKDGLEPDRI